MRQIGVIAWLILCATSQAQTVHDFVLGAKDAVGATPAEVVCGPQVESMSWSPSGRYLLVSRQVLSLNDQQFVQIVSKTATPNTIPMPKSEIIIWDNVARKAKTIFSYPGDKLQVSPFGWFAKSDVCVLAITKNSNDVNLANNLVLVTASSGAQRTIPYVPNRDTPVLSLTQDFLAIETDSSIPAPTYYGPGSAATVVGPPPGAGGDVRSAPIPVLRQLSLKFYKPSGGSTNSINLPPSTVVGCIWSQSGVVCCATKERINNKNVSSWYSINPTTLAVQKMATKPVFESKPSQDEVIVIDAQQKLKDKSNAKVVVLTQKTAKSGDSVNLTTDGDQGVLNDQATATAFRFQGAAVVRNIVHIPADVFAELKKAAQKSDLLSDVKQVGLGLIMFGTDNDDKFPSKDSDWQSALDPYLRNSRLLDGFVYTFAGGSMTGIENPASTELGYKEGPGGRAVIYADGHAKWVPNP